MNTTYNYDSLSRLLSVLHQAGSTVLDGAAYTYDAAGNRTAKTALPANLTFDYSYNPIYELTQALQTSTGKATEKYTYDAVGNRLSQPGVPYTYNNSNEMLTREGVPYTYDANGNTLSKTNGSGTTTYAWDYENRLTSLCVPGTGTVSFKYDPFGRRIESVSPSGTTIYVYDGDNIIEELNADGTLGERYTYGPGVDEPLVGQRQPKVFFYEADGLGSITSLTDPTGAVAATYTYDSFGFMTASTGSATNWFRYTGRQFDSTGGLYYYRARYYDPLSGRFLSEDPIRFQGGVNFYAYTRNDPINFVDPTGLCQQQQTRWDCIAAANNIFIQEVNAAGINDVTDPNIRNFNWEIQFGLNNGMSITAAIASAIFGLLKAEGNPAGLLGGLIPAGAKSGYAFWQILSPTKFITDWLQANSDYEAAVAACPAQ